MTRTTQLLLRLAVAALSGIALRAMLRGTGTHAQTANTPLPAPASPPPAAATHNGDAARTAASPRPTSH